ncbi:MAG: 50S ribosomal protein L9 [Planctomycetota bacterium]
MRNVELLLLDNVDNLGIVGDVVKVRPGYARNYLLPHGLADVPSDEKIAQLAERRKEVEAELKRIAEAQSAAASKLEGHELTLERSANDQGVLFGGVSQHDIAQALRAEGFDIDDRHVRIGMVIKRLDTYDIPIVFTKELKADIKLWVVSDRPMDLDEEAEAARASGDQADEKPRDRDFYVPEEANIDA